MTVQDVRRFIGYLGSDRVSKTSNLGPIRIIPSELEKGTARTVEGIALKALKNMGGGLDVGTRKALETARSLAAAFAKGDVVIYDAKENFIRDIWFRFLNIFRREPFYISKQSIGLGTTAKGDLERAAEPSPQTPLEDDFLHDPFCQTVSNERLQTLARQTKSSVAMILYDDGKGSFTIAVPPQDDKAPVLVTTRSFDVQSGVIKVGDKGYDSFDAFKKEVLGNAIDVLEAQGLAEKLAKEREETATYPSL